MESQHIDIQVTSLVSMHFEVFQTSVIQKLLFTCPNPMLEASKWFSKRLSQLQNTLRGFYTVSKSQNESYTIVLFQMAKIARSTHAHVIHVHDFFKAATTRGRGTWRVFYGPFMLTQTREDLIVNLLHLRIRQTTP